MPSGCVGDSTYSAILARRAARSDALNKFDVYCVKKNGNLYKKPVTNCSFKTRERANEKKARLEELNPQTKFVVVER